MAKLNIKNFKTLAYAADNKFLKSLTSQLDELVIFTKFEQGSPKSRDGHAIQYKDRDGNDVFWAMINSAGTYMIRADKDLFEPVAGS